MNMSLTNICLRLWPRGIRSIHTSTSDFIQISPVLFGEPLKKKKRLDPAIVKARIDRSRKKIMKEIRLLERETLEFIPIEERHILPALKQTLGQRKREKLVLNDDMLSEKFRNDNKWSKFKQMQRHDDCEAVNEMVRARESALKALKEESLDLYIQAIKLDENLIPIQFRGPVETPHIKDFSPGDGDYHNTTKKW